MGKRRRSLGRDVFTDTPDDRGAGKLKKLVEGRAAGRRPQAKEVEIRVKLTPSNIKHLEKLVERLEKQGKGRFSRDELIRIAITLLSTGDF